MCHVFLHVLSLFIFFSFLLALNAKSAGARYICKVPCTCMYIYKVTLVKELKIDLTHILTLTYPRWIFKTCPILSFMESCYQFLLYKVIKILLESMSKNESKIGYCLLCMGMFLNPHMLVCSLYNWIFENLRYGALEGKCSCSQFASNYQRKNTGLQMEELVLNFITVKTYYMYVHISTGLSHRMCLN